MKKFWRGAFISPFSAGLAFFVGAFVYQLVNGQLGTDLLEWLFTGPVMVLGWSLFIGYPVMFLIGLPYVYWLDYKDKLLLKYVCGGAVFLGALTGAFIIHIVEGQLTISLMVIFSVLSLITAFTFCKIEGIKNKLNEKG